jgi:guanylate kinase
MDRVAGLLYSVSWTTRSARETEMHGLDYYFAPKEEFEAMRERDGFLEYAVVHGHLYGTPWPWVNEALGRGDDVILDIDVQGARQLRERMPEAVTVFILPPNFEVLESRLRSRNQNDAADLEQRLRNARSEVRQFENFDYLIINDDLERASQALEAIIVAERHRSRRLREVALSIIETFGG